MIFYIGLTLISLAFIANVTGLAAFSFYHKRRVEPLLKLGKGAFLTAFVMVAFSMGLMLYLILTHRFDFSYVYSYSNRGLSTFYLIASLWAGQEGTFLLWLFFGGIYGLFVMRQKPENMHLILATMMSVHFFILLILLAKSPFSQIWHTFQDAPVGFIPADGRGLNPLLMNPWMVIHPPTLFLGYVSTEVIFGFAISALIVGNWNRWFKQAWPWALYGTAVLGLGIILGGYWAYATLGWGGFWGWDPVENASFVPWMVYAVLIHGLLLQKNRGALVRTNLFLSGLVFVLVLYGSFLTRSGVLTDFSVHSFGESDLNIYLVLFLLFYIGLFLILFFTRFGKIKGEPLKSDVISRETFIVYGMMVLLLSGILTFFGMSFPLISSIFGKPTNVPLSYYNTLHIPIAVLIALLAGLAPFLGWSKAEIKNKKSLIAIIVFSLVITVISIMMGMKGVLPVVMFITAVFFILSNGSMLVQYIGTNFRKAGAYITHVGIALMLIGIIISSFFSTSEKINLPNGEVVETPFGIQLRFEGKIPEKDGRDRMRIAIIQNNEEKWVAKPRFFFSEYNQAWMASPDIDYQLFGDIYIAPIQYMPANQTNSQQFIFGVGKEQRYGDLTLKFLGFEVNNHMEGNALLVGARFELQYTKDGYPQKEIIMPKVEMTAGKMKKESVPFGNYRFEIASLNANTKEVALIVHDQSNRSLSRDILSLEISRKPFISFMWLGTFVLVLGMALSFFDRMKNRSEK